MEKSLILGKKYSPAEVKNDFQFSLILLHSNSICLNHESVVN